SINHSVHPLFRFAQSSARAPNQQIPARDPFRLPAAQVKSGGLGVRYWITALPGSALSAQCAFQSFFQVFNVPQCNLSVQENQKAEVQAVLRAPDMERKASIYW
ncbi:MAG: hypothetical protein ABSH09_21160, partial [Bryobacteraceae bacterium]